MQRNWTCQAISSLAFIVGAFVSFSICRAQEVSDKTEKSSAEIILQARLWKRTFATFDGGEEEPDLIASIKSGPDKDLKNAGRRQTVDFVVLNADEWRSREPLQSVWDNLVLDEPIRGMSCLLKGRIDAFEDGYYYLYIDKLEIPERVGIESEILNRTIRPRDLDNNRAILKYRGPIQKECGHYFADDKAFEFDFGSVDSPIEMQASLEIFSRLIPPDPSSPLDQPLKARVTSFSNKQK